MASHYPENESKFHAAHKVPWPLLTASSPITLMLLNELFLKHAPTQGSILPVLPAWNALALDIHMAHPLPSSASCSNGANQRGLPHLPHKGETTSLVLLYSIYLILFFFIAHVSFRPIIYSVVAIYCFFFLVECKPHEHRILFSSLLKTMYTIGILYVLLWRKKGPLEASFFLSPKSSDWVRYSLNDPSRSNISPLYQVRKKSNQWLLAHIF